MPLNNEYKKLCIIGDFNFPDITWDIGMYKKSGTNYFKFVECMDNFGFVQHNDVPSNKYGHILDLVLSNCPEIVTTVESMIVSSVLIIQI